MLNDHTIQALIERRYSCRTYRTTPIAADTQARLVDFLHDHPAGPFGNTVRMTLLAATEADRQALKGLGTYGFIRGATGFIAGAVAEGAPYTLEDFGYVMERVVLFATALDLGTVWLGGTFTKSRFAEQMALQVGEMLPAVVATGYEADDTRFWDKLIRRGANADRRKPWEELFYAGGFDQTLDREAAGAYSTVLAMVRQAPSASNKQPWRVVREGARWHFYLQRSKRYAPRNNILGVADMQRIDMGIAMCHFALMAEELGLVGAWTVADPGIATPDDATSYVVTWQESEKANRE